MGTIERAGGRGLGGVRSSFRILVGGEDAFTRNSLIDLLEPFGYDVTTASDGRETLRLVHSLSPDLVLADIGLGHVNGFELCRLIKRNPATQTIPIALMTHAASRDERVRGLHAGADDFVSKPVEEIELRARIRSLLRTRTMHLRLENERRLLSARLEERTREINNITLGLVAALEKASELNDIDTGAHIKRVCSVSELLAESVGLPPQMVEKIGRYASLHDIGKVGVPDVILKKQSSLTPDEWTEMKRHTRYGFDLLRAARADAVAQNIAYYHHEKFDGSGYPKGLHGPEIPVEARIVAISDVFDALVSRRCYKEPIARPVAVDMIVRQSGRHFDPDLVMAFQNRMGEIFDIHDAYADRVPSPGSRPSVAEATEVLGLAANSQ